ncbi:hypothetical protein, partial [Helicobacter pylori]|uniref:hypothetical protein n=1 Tax=Helicobacter pylori TaxID=210 RepID=UPI001C7DC4DA
MTSTPPNETKSVKIKKMTKFFQNDKKKKKRFHAIILQIHSNANVFQCMKSLILKSNLIQKGEYDEKNPFTLSLS